jgi:restriction system protein
LHTAARSLRPLTAFWGIHNNRPEVDFVDNGFVALGWDLIAQDATPLVDDRDLLKAELARAYPHKNPPGHRRVVTWLNTGLPRDAFTQEALWEIGSTLTFFRIRNHVPELIPFT